MAHTVQQTSDAPKKPVEHTIDMEMVKAAMIALKGSKGSNIQSILKTVMESYVVEEDSTKVNIKKTMVDTAPVKRQIISGDPTMELAEEVDKQIPRPDPRKKWNLNRTRKLIETDGNQPVIYYLSEIVEYVANQVALLLTAEGIDGGPAVYYAYTREFAKKLKNLLMRSKLYDERNPNYIHEWLVRYLPIRELARYFDLVKFLSVFGSGRVLQMDMMTLGTDLAMNTCHNMLLQFTITPVVDPYSDLVTDSVDELAIDRIVFVIVHPNIFKGDSTTAHLTMLRDLLPGIADQVSVKMTEPERCSDKELLEHYTDEVMGAIDEVVKKNLNRHVVVVGWGVTCRLVQRALQFVAGVSCAILLAYPERALLADPDDEANLTYCPTLFVCGEAKKNPDYLELIKETQQYYISRADLVVVNDADVNLQVSPDRLAEGRLTQMLVDRIVLQHIHDFIQDFLNLVVGGARQHKSIMKPIEIDNYNEKFPVNLKAFPQVRSGRPLKGSCSIDASYSESMESSIF
ncbi:hypothetical protein L596_018706 [Steinernema carpocapsae]|uniref:Uncharacterized protein n=1 Tax=Steinernema carpocapsae TaxID=34508 RepID=A0A4U5N5Y0_STECR|nr:hypothetical protein L596_018706 [Steinernema carpocapsae]